MKGKENCFEGECIENSDDRRELFCKSKSAELGAYAMLVMCIIITVYDLYQRMIPTGFAIMSIYLIFLTFEGLGMYVYTRKKSKLISMGIAGILSIGFLVSYFYLTYK